MNNARITISILEPLVDEFAAKIKVLADDHPESEMLKALSELYSDGQYLYQQVYEECKSIAEKTK